MSFTAQIAGFGVRATERIQRVRRGVTIKLFNSVIRDTPVDTGRARANWQLTEGTPATGTLSSEIPGKTALDGDQLATVEKTDGDTPIFLANNLPYIGKLEYGGYSPGDDISKRKGGSKVNSSGFSKQAPNGMVRKNVVRFGTLITIQLTER